MTKDEKRRPPTARELCFLRCSRGVMMMMNEANQLTGPSLPPTLHRARPTPRPSRVACQRGEEQEPRALGKGNGGEAAGPVRAS